MSSPRHSPSSSPLFVGIGELLWDLLPAGRELGGAVTNFAYQAQCLGNRGVIASRLGTDDLGRELAARVQALGLETTYLQRDTQHPTGTVPVTIAADGQPQFVITPEVAWDYLAWTPVWRALAAQADVVCFGTLGSRAPVARATIRRFLAATRPTALHLCDLNFRQTYYDRDLVEAMLARTQVLKLNDVELPLVVALLELGTATGDLLAGAQALRQRYDLRVVCVTRGAHGSLLVSADGAVDHPGLPTRVVDTVGAGDAFTAALAHHLWRGSHLAIASAAANRLGSHVAAHRGGTPPADPAVIAAVQRGAPAR